MDKGLINYCHNPSSILVKLNEALNEWLISRWKVGEGSGRLAAKMQI